MKIGNKATIQDLIFRMKTSISVQVHLNKMKTIASKLILNSDLETKGDTQNLVNSESESLNKCNTIFF